MIAETVALLLYVAQRAAVESVAAAVVEVRWRRSRKHKAASVSDVAPDSDMVPRKATSVRIIQGENGKWIVIQSGRAGIEDVYSRVPPFNQGK